MYEAAASRKDIARAPVTNWDPSDVTPAGYWYAMIQGMKLVQADRPEHVHSIFISNSSVAWRIGPSGCNLLVTATEKLPVRALSYKTVLSIPGNKIVNQLKLPVRAWPTK
jgi:hypothetical protein